MLESVKKERLRGFIMHSRVSFTLIELSVVVALVMIVATLVMVHGTYMHRVLVHAEIEKLALICRYLQNGAMTTNQEKTLKFDLKNRTYAYDSTKGKLSCNVEFGMIDGIKGPPSHPTETIQKPITFKNNTITFYPDGIIQAGTLYLISSDKQVMYALSNSVSQVSYMRIYKYDKRWHCLT